MKRLTSSDNPFVISTPLGADEKVIHLQFLAQIIEAIPSLPASTDLVGLIMAREPSTNTTLGKAGLTPCAGLI